MRTLSLYALSAIMIWVSAVSAALADVVTYPMPASEPHTGEYEVLANGKKVDVYTARTLDTFLSGKQSDHGGPYYFAGFDTSGPVTVRITAKRSLRKVVVRPEWPADKLTRVNDHTVTLALDRPRKLSIEPAGKEGPLFLFANPLEQNAPKLDAPDVLYFGPGIHKKGKIDVCSGQTVYLAGGAVVKGAISAVGSNIRICGRGILDGSDYRWRQGPCHSIQIEGSDVTVEGITIRGAPQWTIVPTYSRQVTIRNVKICNSRVPNDDGIDICNSQKVFITDCFIRSDDDCVAMKGMDIRPSANSNVERVFVENCIFWCDRARVFLLGHESRARWMRKITLRNLHVLHFTLPFALLEPGEEMRLEDITVENIRIDGQRQAELIRLCPTVNEYMRKKTPGSIRNVLFNNIVLTGEKGDYLIQLQGADPKHAVRHVTFQNVSIRDALVSPTSPYLRVGKHVDSVRFLTE